MRRHFSIAALLLCLPALMACLWDYDTLMQERSRFPKALELITGKYLRHSTEFYQWRIQDRLKKLETDPDNLAWLDDLGVAYAKTGQVDKAIETMARKERIKPDQYETAANLGTFYIYAGRLEDAQKEIEKALRINPDAHFGREKYQLALVKYILARRKAGVAGLPLREKLERESFGFTGFAGMVIDKESATESVDGQRQAALKGVMGMMRAGHHEMPILLEVLGDLLYHGAPANDGKQLAARAYLKASYGVSDAEAARYRELAERTLDLHTESKLHNLEPKFKAEIAEADAWYADLKAKEIGWIKDGINPEEEFEKLYKADPEIETGKPQEVIASPFLLRTGFAIAAGIGALALLGCLFWKLLRGV